MIMPTKKQLTIIVVSIVILILAMIITVFVLNGINKKNNTNNPTDINQGLITQANNLKAEAYTAAKNNQADQAKTLYEDAKKIYQNTNNTDSVAEIDTALYLIDNLPTTPTPAEVKNTGNGSEQITINQFLSVGKQILQLVANQYSSHYQTCKYAHL